MIATVVAAIVVALIAIPTGFGLWLSHKADSNVTHAALLPGQGDPPGSPTPGAAAPGAAGAAGAGAGAGASGAPGTAGATAGATPPGDPGTQGEATLTQPTRVASMKDSLNYLLIGSDSRGTDRGRSDVIIVAHINSDRTHVDLIHVPRDLYVTIPGYGKDKINAAYAWAGAPLLVSTLQPLLGVPIDHVAVIDFQGFVAMTDALGGVDVPVRESSPGYQAGTTVHLTGAQGLAFVRDRHDLGQGDISRGRRQMDFIRAVLTASVTPRLLLNPVTLTKVVDAATSNLTLDESLSTDALRSLALSMRSVRGGDISQWTAPWSKAARIRGRAVILPASGQWARLREALRTDAMSGYSDAVSPTKGFG